MSFKGGLMMSDDWVSELAEAGTKDPRVPADLKFDIVERLPPEVKLRNCLIMGFL